MTEITGWMKQAVDALVISEAEAREIQGICLKTDGEYVRMPQHLNAACERILLWELEAPPGIH